MTRSALTVCHAGFFALLAGIASLAGCSRTPPDFEKQALFVAKVRRSGEGPARVVIRGQACRETICKNVNVALRSPSPASA